MKLTERDRHLCGMLAGGRWLTTEPLSQLCFPERNERDIRRRLRQLSGGDGAPALLVRHPWPTLHRLRHVWGLTPAGYAEAEQLLDEDFFLPPKGFEPQTMAHHEMLTQLYVALLAAPLEAALARIPKTLSAAERKRALAGLFARAFHRGWRWTVVGDGVHLAWKYQEGNLWKKRVMRPDAVLELTEPRRRVFIECETGSNTIVPRFGDNKPNSTLSKMDRWEDFVGGLASYQPRETHYEQRYPDGYTPEVLFLVHSERRAKNVTAAIEQWRSQQHSRPDLVARAWTLSTTLGELLPLSGALKPEPARAREGLLPVAANALSNVEAAALVRCINGINAEHEARVHRAAGTRAAPPTAPEGWEMAKLVAKRLREGAPPVAAKAPRVLVSGELRLIRNHVGELEAGMHTARVDAQRRGVPLPKYPATRDQVKALLEKLSAR